METMAKHAERVDIQQVAAYLRELNYFVGIVDLALCRARRVDPRDYAKIVYRKQIQDPGEMQDAVRIFSLRGFIMLTIFFKFKLFLCYDFCFDRLSGVHEFTTLCWKL